MYLVLFLILMLECFAVLTWLLRAIPVLPSMASAAFATSVYVGYSPKLVWFPGEINIGHRLLAERVVLW
jgi:hypothetical protein